MAGRTLRSMGMEVSGFLDYINEREREAVSGDYNLLSQEGLLYQLKTHIHTVRKMLLYVEAEMPLLPEENETIIAIAELERLADKHAAIQVSIGRVIYQVENSMIGPEQTVDLLDRIYREMDHNE